MWAIVTTVVSSLARPRGTIPPVNTLDLVLILVLVVAGFSGYRRGFVLQVFTYGGLLVGIVAGAVLAPALAGLVESPAAQALVAVATLFCLGAAGDAAGWLIGTRARARARRSRLGAVDAPGGAGVSVIATLLVIWFVGLNLVNGPVPQIASEIRGSAIVRGLERTLPHPPSLLAQVRQFFNSFGFPDVFSGIPPAPAEPVRAPTQAQARRAFEAADQSTLRIVGQACDHIIEGSGFVVADSYVLTNAHVVAGVRQPQVQSQDGGSVPATTVLFDPDLDLAVLRLEGTPPVLPLLQTVAGRGAKGAILGYPGGGPLTGGPGAVRDTIPAVGHDIYGRSEVDREVYELQAVVRPGNSGGPFVLVDGRVAGVVFAASTTDQDIGYAIPTTVAMPDLRTAIGLSQRVSTGPCLP
jgi:S1-C subfamily serine protease